MLDEMVTEMFWLVRPTSDVCDGYQVDCICGGCIIRPCVLRNTARVVFC